MPDQDINNIKRQYFGPKLGERSASLSNPDQSSNRVIPPSAENDDIEIELDLGNSTAGTLPAIPTSQEVRAIPSDLDQDELELAEPDYVPDPPALPAVTEVASFNSKTKQLIDQIKAKNKSVWEKSGHPSAEFDPDVIDPNIVRANVEFISKRFLAGLQLLEHTVPKYYREPFAGTAPIDVLKYVAAANKDIYETTLASEKILKEVFQNSPAQLREKFYSSVIALTNGMPPRLLKDSMFISAEDVYTDATGRYRVKAELKPKDENKKAAPHLSLKERAAMKLKPGAGGSVNMGRDPQSAGGAKDESEKVVFDERPLAEINQSSKEDYQKNIDSQDLSVNESLKSGMQAKHNLLHRLYGPYSKCFLARMDEIAKATPKTGFNLEDPKTVFETENLGLAAAVLKSWGETIFSYSDPSKRAPLYELAEVQVKHDDSLKAVKPYLELEQNIAEVAELLRLADTSQHLDERSTSLLKKLAPSSSDFNLASPDAALRAQTEKQQYERQYKNQVNLVAAKLIADFTLPVIRAARDEKSRAAIANKLAIKYLADSNWKPSL